MKKKFALCLSIIAIVTLLLISILVNIYKGNNDMSDYWAGSYTFYEYCPPDQNMTHTISFYHDEGSLYANIKIDGFQTLQRLKAKVWSNGEEIMFVFHDNYTDEEGYTSFPERHNEGDILLKFKKQDDILITEWGILQPLLIENEIPGQYFTKVEE